MAMPRVASTTPVARYQKQHHSQMPFPAVTLEKSLQFMVIETDILILPMFQPESVRNCAQLDEAQAFIEMAGMDIGCHNRIELQYFEPMQMSLMQTVSD